MLRNSMNRGFFLPMKYEWNDNAIPFCTWHGES